MAFNDTNMNLGFVARPHAGGWAQGCSILETKFEFMLCIPSFLFVIFKQKGLTALLSNSEEERSVLYF